MAQLKIPLSFKSEERYMYDYVKKQFNYSAYIKSLISKDMEQQKPKKQVKNIGFDF